MTRLPCCDPWRHAGALRHQGSCPKSPNQKLTDEERSILAHPVGRGSSVVVKSRPRTGLVLLDSSNDPAKRVLPTLHEEAELAAFEDSRKDTAWLHEDPA